MTTPDALNALADRVEREEPSRPLEGDIFEAVGGERWEWAIARAQEPCGCPEEAARIDARLRAPLYTTSLDAAVTLVPEGWRWAAVYEHPQGAFSANLDKPNFSIARGYARTEVAARVIAALRARAADMQARAPEQKGSEQ